MASKFKYINTPLDNKFAKSNLAVPIGTSNVFKLSDKGFIETPDVYYCKGGPYNGGTWGELASAPYNNPNSDSPIPFMDPRSAPQPYLSTNGERWFSTSSTDKTYQNSLTKFITLDSSSTYNISYSNNNIIIKKAGTTIHTLKASPYILLSVQARGGAGGTGYYNGAWWIGEYYYTSGGGGGSGAFAEFTFNLSKLSGVSVSQTSIGLVVDFGNQCIIRHGSAGGNSGETSAGLGGNGGTISYANAAGDSISSPNISAKAYVLNTIPGAKGGSGGRRQTGISYSSGSASSNLSTRSLKLSSAGVTANVRLDGTTTASSVGAAYGSTSGNDVAGGGGAPSLMSNGNSGAYGAGAHGGYVESKEVKSAGARGGAAIWITYISDAYTQTFTKSIVSNPDSSDQCYIMQIPISEFTSPITTITSVTSTTTGFTLSSRPEHPNGWTIGSSYVNIYIGISGMSDGKSVTATIVYS